MAGLDRPGVDCSMSTPPLFALIAGLLTILLAGVTSGLTGFGFALIAVPLLVIFLPAKAVVPIVMLLSNLTHFVILWQTRGQFDLPRVWRLMLAGCIGMPLGTYLLLLLDARALKILIGAVITVFALALLLGLKKPIRNEKLASFPVGFVSGLLSGSTAMGGPPAVLFLSNQGVDKAIFRANLNVYFTVLSLVTIPFQAVGGLLTTSVLTYTAYFVPALVVGTLAGCRISSVIPEVLFRKLTLAVVLLAGAMSVLTGAGVL
jgi:uncharacterized protein